MAPAEGLVVVAGLGEVGRPLMQLMQDAGCPVLGVDVDPVPLPEPGETAVLHLCFPFEAGDFVALGAGYVERLQPRLTVVDSTVAIGTTRALADRTGAPVVHSPIRGKHAHMRADLERYDKFVGALDADDAGAAVAHFASVGLYTRVLSSPEASELAKLSETTYFGLLIAWAQEMERRCDAAGADYDEVVAFYEEIGFLPPVTYTPGVIGGHCVLPNLAILERQGTSPLLDALLDSNARKVQREAHRVA